MLLKDIDAFPVLPSKLDGDESEYERGYHDATANLNALPTVDAVEIDVVKKWLYAIAMNNVGQAVEDMAAACVEIIKRLDGLRKFAEERRENQ